MKVKIVSGFNPEKAGALINTKQHTLWGFARMAPKLKTLYKQALIKFNAKNWSLLTMGEAKKQRFDGGFVTKKL